MKSILRTAALLVLILGLLGARTVKAEIDEDGVRTEPSVVSGAAGTDPVILTGEDRYATARLFCRAYAEKKGALPTEVILVTGQDFPDALASNALAGVKACPVILSRRQALPEETEALLSDDWHRSVKKVTYVGGGFDPSVAETLRSSCGVETVDETTFAGSDRYDTADRVCRYVMTVKDAGTEEGSKEGGPYGRLCFVTTGRKAADALSAAAWSYAYRLPILLANSSGELSAASKELASRYEEIVILGGEAAVSKAAERAFGSHALRIGGNDRYETSVNIAYHFRALYCEEKAGRAVFAPGKNANFPDALVAGPYAGMVKDPVILVNDGGFTDNALAVFAQLYSEGSAGSGLCFGGAAGVNGIPDTVLEQIRTAVSGLPENEKVFLTGQVAAPDKDAEIAAGVYEIASAKVPALCLTVPGGTCDDTVITLDKNKAQNSQRFVIRPLGQGKYSIVNEASGRSLDIPSASKESGTPVSQHRRNQSEAQTFYIRKGPSGTVSITPAHASLPFGVRECNTVPGAPLEIRTYMGCASRFFILSKTEAGLSGNGVMMIHSAADDSLVLTVSGDGRQSGQVIRLEKASSSKASAQRFTVTGFKDGWLISPVSSNLALDLKGGLTDDGTAVQQYTRNGTVAQMWLLRPDGAGGFKIAAVKKPEAVITPSDMKAGTASDLVLRTEGSVDQALWQSFTLEMIDKDRILSDGVYTIASFADPGYVFDVENASRAYKANVRLHKDNGTGAQQFSVLYLGNGLYKIKNVHSAQTLDPADGSTSDGTNIRQYKDNGTEAQKWRFAPLGDGSFKILSAAGTVMSYEGDSPSGNANIRLSKSGSSRNQLFTFKSVRVKPVTDIYDMPAGSLPEEGTFDRKALDQYFKVYPITQGDAVFNRMTGKSYPAGCPLPLSSLRYIKVLHVNFDGRVQVGEMVTNANNASDVAAILKQLFTENYQIRQMRLVDDFWDGTPEKTDLKSMAQDNSSSFNYRRGSNQTTGLSYHAYGYAVDINPLENPYVEFDGAGRIRYYEPANAGPYLDRSGNKPHYITSSDAACRLFKQYGFRWLGDNPNPADYQHFERVR